MSRTCQIFTASQISDLRKGGAILRDCLEHVASLVKPGVTTADLDKAAETFITARGGKPAFKGYQGYKATLCTSVNDEIVHGIPGPRVLKDGDIISLDNGVIYGGLYTDACVSVGVGNISPQAQTFLDTISQTLELVVKDVVKSGVQVGTISAFIQRHIESAGYTVVRQLTGHGLGNTLHQFPDIPNWGKQGTGPELPVHTLIAIEPIAVMGGDAISTDDDGWTIRTKDGSLAGHFEHTLLITEGGCEVIA